MDKALILRGKLTSRRQIELSEPVNDVDGEVVGRDVEVFLRVVEPTQTKAKRDVFEFVRSLPVGNRSMEDILKQVAEERDAWE